MFRFHPEPSRRRSHGFRRGILCGASLLFLVNADVVDVHANGELDRGHVAAALAASVQLERNGILGVSFGSSMAGGYVNGVGCITGRLNELAFVPVDYSASAPCDEWSGDRGCGVNYFSQQGAARLAAIHSIRRSCSPASG